METQELGATGQKISALGLGCMGMSEFYGPADQKEALSTIHSALDSGLNFLDTADVYGIGKNEALLGQALKDRRDQAFLATKFGIVRDQAGNFVGENGRPDYVQQACEASLMRLGVSVIDLYYQHRVDAHIPIEETVGAMAQLVEQGKVRYLGLSEANPSTIRRAHAVHPITALQTEYSLWSREPEKELLDTCRELNITFVAYSPLGRGFLTGHITKMDDLAADDRRRVLPRFQGENLDKNMALVRKLETLATAKGITTAQLALAWVWAQGKNVIPLVGTKRRRHLEENIEALQVTLTNQELQELQAIAPDSVAAGARYPDAGMQTVNR